MSETEVTKEDLQAQHDYFKAQLEQLEGYINAKAKTQGISISERRNTGKKAEYLIDFVIGRNADIKENNLRLRQDVTTWMRAVSLIAESVSSATSHKEKDARLRGLVSIIESAINRIRENYNQLGDWHWDFPDIFTCDYPVRGYLERIKELETKNKVLDQIQDKLRDIDDPQTFVDEIRQIVSSEREF